MTLCRNALLLAAQLQTKTITPENILHTIDKTAHPDPERRARAAVAGMPARAFGKRPAGIFREPAPRTPQARDRRAADMLLRSARDRQGAGGE